ncbi:MAG: hypothetical protein HY300_03995 [Verrucomicrobia bacterium]|nr:hypothetical protein [Verrucomicrobiota bacterium]
MNRVFASFLLACFCGVLAVSARAAEPAAAPSAKFKLLSGDILEGEAISPNDKGVIIKSLEGKLSTRIAWTNFSQEALKELAKNPKAKSIAEIFIEQQDDDIDTSLMPVVQKRDKPQIKLNPVEKPELYATRPGFFGSIFSSSIGWFTLLLIYAANLYAAFEVAIYRRRPLKPVIGIAAAAPVIAPVVFLCLPEVKEVKENPQLAAMAAEAADVKAPAPKSMHKGPAGKSHGAPPAADAPTMVSAAPAAPAAPAIPKTQYFRRGEVSFNRRFVETKFAPFFKMVLSEKEQDLFLVFNTVRGQFVTQRVVKVSQTDATIQIEAESGASYEESFPFNDIQEVQIRHREAQD